MPKQWQMLVPSELGAAPRWEDAATWGAGANLGLMWQRYLPCHTAGEDKAPVLTDFVEIAQKAQTQQRELIERVLGRRLSVLERAGGRVFHLGVRWRMITGLALASSFENGGIAIDWTYGFPVIPAATLKGVLSQYLIEEFEGYDGPAQRRALVAELGELGSPSLETVLESGETVTDLRRRICGGDDPKRYEGACLFLDAWPEPDRGWLEVDVLTPHHLEYYGGSGWPLDSDDPDPHHFLVVARDVRFQVGLAMTETGRRRERGDAILDLARELLVRACSAFGVGAKTGSGYGGLRRTDASPRRGEVRG